MANNISLTKPAGTDKYNIGTFNTNFTKIETAVNALNDEVSALQSSGGSSGTSCDCANAGYITQDTADETYAAKSHTHSEYAAASHTHSNYLTTTTASNTYATKTAVEAIDGRVTALEQIDTGDGTVDLSGYVTDGELTTALSGYATADHTHNEYAAASHTHDYAASNHTHSEYLTEETANTLYALADHTHDSSGESVDLTGYLKKTDIIGESTSYGEVYIGKNYYEDDDAKNYEGTNSVRVGFNSYSNNIYSVAVGAGAVATKQNAIQLGVGVNAVEKSFNVGLGDTDEEGYFKSYPLLTSGGFIPEERIPNTIARVGSSSGGGGTSWATAGDDTTTAISITLADATEYTYTAEAASLTITATNFTGESIVHFTSGSTKTTFTCENVKMMGLNCYAGTFKPISNMIYTIMFDYDGTNVVGYVGGYTNA